MMLSIHRLLPFLLLVLPHEAIGRRPWSLPLRIGTQARLVRRDFSSHKTTTTTTTMSPTALGLTGGETPLPLVPDDDDSDKPVAEDEAAAVAPNVSDEIARGGGAAVKSKKKIFAPTTGGQSAAPPMRKQYSPIAATTAIKCPIAAVPVCGMADLVWAIFVA